MTMREELRERWFASFLSIAAGLILTSALVFSASTYVSVMDARQGTTLKDATESAETLPNGTLRISLSISMENPSRLDINVQSISWSVRVDNSTSTETTYIPLFTVYGVPEMYSVIGAHETITFEFSRTVNDQQTLERLEGFVGYWEDQGEDYSLESIRYLHDFRVVGWIEDFDHDYTYWGESYLNDMVKIDEKYIGGVYL